jgi:predicted ATPase
MQRHTNWIVITGAPSSGKTAVIDVLHSRGYQTIPEVARAYIDSRLARGESLVQIKANVAEFEHHILHEKIRVESSLPTRALLFFDRGVPDSVAYFELEGLDAREPLRLCRQRRYRRVFMMDRLEFKIDEVRSENDATAARLEFLLLKAYRRLNYPVIRIPAGDVQQRADRVLDHL